MRSRLPASSLITAVREVSPEFAYIFTTNVTFPSELVVAAKDNSPSMAFQLFCPFHPVQHAAISSKSAVGGPLKYVDAMTSPLKGAPEILATKRISSA